MKQLCYYLAGNYEKALHELVQAIPCFFWYEEDNSVSIVCREEDVAFVERKLQDVV